MVQLFYVSTFYYIMYYTLCILYNEYTRIDTLIDAISSLTSSLTRISLQDLTMLSKAVEIAGATTRRKICWRSKWVCGECCEWSVERHSMTWWNGYNSSRFATQRKHEIHPSWHFGGSHFSVQPFWAIHSLSNSPSRCTDDSRSFHWHPRICDMVSTGNQSLGFQFNDFFQQVRSPDTELPPMNCCSFWRTNEVTRKSHCKKVADMPYVTYTKFPTLATMKNIGIWPSNWHESNLISVPRKTAWNTNQRPTQAFAILLSIVKHIAGSQS